MKQFDVVVIGGGIVGCFAARELRRWQLSVALVEAADDICTGITRANSAIVYAGYDNKVGSLKARMTVQGNAAMAQLCEELEVPFSRCGSLLVSTDSKTQPILEKKLRHGRENGVPQLYLLSGKEARAMEPMLTEQVTAALYAPSTGTVNPWLLGIAAFENAVHNGCEPYIQTRVLGIQRTSTGYVVQTDRAEFTCRAVINCAGAAADKVQELLFAPSVRLHLDAADYLVLDKLAPKPSRVIFHQAESCGKGITAIPTTDGNLLLSGVRRPLTTPYATTADGLRRLHADAKRLLPDADLSRVIRSFGAVRPNPYRVVAQNGRWIPDGSGIGNFCIEHPDQGFFSLMGIKTPGLTCARELGYHVASRCAEELCAAANPAFDPVRKHKIMPGGPMICRCEQITEAEILDAIARGARTLDGVKRRCGSGMGRCQGSRCSYEIEQLLEAYRHGPI